MEVNNVYLIRGVLATAGLSVFSTPSCIPLRFPPNQFPIQYLQFYGERLGASYVKMYHKTYGENKGHTFCLNNKKAKVIIYCFL